MHFAEHSLDATVPADVVGSLCEREQIHLPGAIQPHGALLAFLPADGIITHASANLAEYLGCSGEDALGRSLGQVVGMTTATALSSTGHSAQITHCDRVSEATSAGQTLQLRAYVSGRHICVDILPTSADPGRAPPFTMAQTVLDTFTYASSRVELCELAVRGLRTIIGYDRVMAYRFSPNGDGEVIAEARAAHLEPYLGLRYPASDIPKQARRHYTRQRVGAIVDSNYRPVPVLVDPAIDDGTPLDLTHSYLRSVSPVHREYMRNMGTAASLTIGLAHEVDHLWGMLVCHHETPRTPGPELLAVGDMIGQVVSLLLGSLAETESYARRLTGQATLRVLQERLAAPMALAECVVSAQFELLQLVAASGVMLRLSGKLMRFGSTPPQHAAEQAFASLLSIAGGNVLAIDDFGLRYPELTECTSQGSGALLLPLTTGTDDGILWFRPELSRTIAWGGNPAEHATLDPLTGRLSPRASFAAWTETVRGLSAPWTEADIALARELNRAIEAEVAQRTKAELARLRHFDPLTGLPNRSFLQDRLREAERDPTQGTAIVFLDLDRFKAVNDTMGHPAGDALLVEVAHRLLEAAGPDNFTARLGGDEFVVLCRGLDNNGVAQLGERIRRAVERPIDISGRLCHVSASIGIATTGLAGELDLVRAADMAMYAAKKQGGNQGVTFAPALYAHAARQFELDRDLRLAIGSGDQLALVYQPLFKIEAGTRVLHGFEALARWHHPRLGWVPPDQFIPLAEKSGLILPLGKWALATALHQVKLFDRAAPLQMAVNVSALQLAEPGFCSALSEMLQAEGFPPEALCLEVTESMLTDAAVSYVLADIRQLGVHVAIDDFGMGYSSLSYLCRLPVNIVKLDQNFTQSTDATLNGANFLQAVVSLAHAAGLRVVLEGIETQAHWDVALACGTDMVQGFLFARPLSAQQATELAAEAASPVCC